MADGVTIASATLTATGITLFGVSTGLAPSVLIAGFAGALWAQSYYPPTPWIKRVALTALGAILAGYFAPAVASGLGSYESVRAIVPVDALQLPVAVVIGLLAHRVLGPRIMRLASKKLDDVAK